LLAAVVASLVLEGTAPMPRGEATPADARLWHEAGVVRFDRPRQAPPFELSDVSGRRVSLRQLQGRVVLLYFWGSW
jgi:cytochrome oxidase Cu insertion factor (SCO1/SenC/PrrC family)